VFAAANDPRRHVVFQHTPAGRVARLVVGETRLARRQVGPESGNQLVITPVRPIGELRREALAAQPPVERGPFLPFDLVELTTLDPTIKLEIRYATSNNLFGTPFYSQARAFLQRLAAEALVRVNAALHRRGFGLLVHDGYRPWYVTKMFWDASPADKHVFVADPATGSKHNRGAAVDLTLYDLTTGAPVEMVSTYDETSPRAYPNYPGGTSRQRWHRELLRRAMEAERFTVYEAEWWHFDYADWQKYPIGNVDFKAKPSSTGLDRSAPAIDRDDCSRDVARARGSKECDNARYLVGAGRPLHRRRQPQRLRPLACRTLGVDWPGRHSVHAHAFRTEFSRPRASHGLERRFGRPVRCAARKSYPSRHAADVDDASGASRGHRWRDRPDEEKRRADVARKQCIELLGFQFRSFAEHCKPGIVHENVQRPRVDHQSRYLRGIAEISADEGSSTSRRRDRPHGRGPSLSIAAMDDDVSAILGELESDCATESGGRSRHEGALPAQIAASSMRHEVSSMLLLAIAARRHAGTSTRALAEAISTVPFRSSFPQPTTCPRTAATNDRTTTQYMI
jgi:D-alanyl-D-alanine dipeptidase